VCNGLKLNLQQDMMNTVIVPRFVQELKHVGEITFPAPVFRSLLHQWCAENGRSSEIEIATGLKEIQSVQNHVLACAKFVSTLAGPTQHLRTIKFHTVDSANYLGFSKQQYGPDECPFPMACCVNNALRIVG